MPDAGGGLSAAPPRRWIAYEKNAAVLLGEAAAATAKNICLTSGEKIPRRQVWIDDMPPPPPALQARLTAPSGQPPAEDLWRAADGQTLTLAALAAAAGRDSADIGDLLAVLQQVLANPIYFRRHNHLISAAPAETVQKALASVRQRRRQQQIDDALLAQLQQGELPALLRDNKDMLLYAPDKSAPAYRLLKRHLGGDAHPAFPRFFLQHGGLENELEYFENLFSRQWPPREELNGADAVSALPPLPAVTAPAISIDDAGTREIDDAFSLTDLPDGGWRLGIHIAAPALALAPRADAAARVRQTSVYFPHAKHFMLPAAALAACSLSAGAARAAVSLYLEIDPPARAWRFSHNALECVTLSRSGSAQEMENASLPPALAAMTEKLHVAADILAEQMAAAAPSNNYKIDAQAGQVLPRPQTGLRRVVEILMRCANSVWGRQIADARIGGLFRADGMTRLKPPAQMPPYMWLTSPLRRYADLANQRLLIALINQTPPPRENWRLLQKQFDKQHYLARHFQRLMDTYWALRILQEGAAARTAHAAVYLGKKRARLCAAPLTGILPAALPGVAADSPIEVYVTGIDLLKQRLSLAAADAP